MRMRTDDLLVPARRRQFVVALVLVGLVAGGGAIALASFGASQPVSVGSQAAATDTGITLAAASPTRAPSTAERFDGRDPFQPPNGSGNGSDPSSGGGNGDSGGPSGRRVTLIDIFEEDGERFATVEVDGEQYTVAEGDVFADNFQVIDITARCATFLFGDERFTLCIGQEVRK